MHLRFHLRLYKGYVLVREYSAYEAVIKIGKLSSSHVRIDDPNVSRLHAIIEVTSSRDVHVIDLSSLTGTFVNGHRVNKARLRSGDSIVVGETRIEVTFDVDAPKLDVDAPKLNTKEPVMNQLVQDKVAAVVIGEIGVWICELMAAEHQAVVDEMSKIPSAAGDAYEAAARAAMARRDIWYSRAHHAGAVADATAKAAAGDFDAAKAALPEELRPKLKRLKDAIDAALASKAPVDDGTIRLRIVSPRLSQVPDYIAAYAAPIVTVGASPSNHIVAHAASDTHASISRIGKGIWVGNLNPEGEGVHLVNNRIENASTNNVAGTPITHTHLLKPGDWIRIGDVYIALPEDG